jgi:hypothetical protein
MVKAQTLGWLICFPVFWSRLHRHPGVMVVGRTITGTPGRPFVDKTKIPIAWFLLSRAGAPMIPSLLFLKRQVWRLNA